MYLVITGNEYGYDLTAFDFGTTILFISDKADADEKFKKYLEEYGCAAMYKVHPNKFEQIREENIF